MIPAHLCVGSLALNDTVYADGRTSMAAPGGNALYAAVAARIWSEAVGIVAVVGYDWPPGYTEALIDGGIDTRGLISLEAETVRAWTIYEADGFRRYFSRNREVVPLTPSPYSSTPPTPAQIQAYNEAARRVHLRMSPRPQDLQPDLWGARTLHLCPMRIETVETWLEALASHTRIVRSVDILPYAVQGDLDDVRLLGLLSNIDVFMPSEIEARALQPDYEAETLCRELAARGPRVVVIKEGERGAAVYDRETDRCRRVPAYPAQVTDLTGAGDSFCGGFSVGYALSGDPFEAALYGTVSASFIIEGFGGLHALAVTRRQAEARLAELRRMSDIGLV
ncbi:MAG: carbohydrate kinase family protein [Anaerolineae bacterium]